MRMTTSTTYDLSAIYRAILAMCSEDDQQWLITLDKELKLLPHSIDKISTLSSQSAAHVSKHELTTNSFSVLFGSKLTTFRRWNLADIVRTYLYLVAVSLDRIDTVNLIKQIYRQGDEHERATIVRGLVLYLDNDGLKNIALETGRVNSVFLFSALAYDNPYPELYYSEHEFNQLVMKSLFMGLRIEHIIGLANRCNPELSRMCEDYIEERLAASRPIPTDIWLAMTKHASGTGRELLQKYINSPDPEHRKYASMALSKFD